MNKETSAVIVRATEGLQINSDARVSASRASKRPSTELHKVNEAVRLLMAAMSQDKVFASQISQAAQKKLWAAWLAMNSALSEQALYEKEQRVIVRAQSTATLRNPYECMECGRTIVMANGEGHAPGWPCSLEQILERAS
jgi:hypothetical protein